MVLLNSSKAIQENVDVLVNQRLVVLATESNSALELRQNALLTLAKVAEICGNITGSNMKPIYKEDRPREVKHATCSADKARKLLNYQTSTNLYDGILRTFE